VLRAVQYKEDAMIPMLVIIQVMPVIMIPVNIPLKESVVLAL
tara:strand:+ start:735 stop:860 length:126 start_codon:yes stop_codon:yes gene_type:complete